VLFPILHRKIQAYKSNLIFKEMNDLIYSPENVLFGAYGIKDGMFVVQIKVSYCATMELKFGLN
jgi:hypothetical protein